MTKLEKYISRKIGKATCDFDMLEDGDRVAVGISGGKDSLSLLKILDQRKKITPIKYEVLAIHLDMGYGCVKSKRLKKFFKDNGFKHVIKKINILDTVGGDRKKINCFWCSWNRRKHLFQLAHKHKCKKLALGHHKDDIIQTLLLNMFFQGNRKAMAPKQRMFGGKICIIRPLAYVEGGELAKFAKESGFPLSCCKCPNANSTNRDLMRTLIGRVEKVCKEAKTNLFNSADLTEYD